MKVIILATKEVKEVALGHALNYLLPKGLAVLATKERLTALKKAKAAAQAQTKASQLEQRQQAEKLDGKVVEFKLKAGKNGRLHGSITKKEIAEKLKINKQAVVLTEPIKKIGDWPIELKFGQVMAKIKVKLTNA